MNPERYQRLQALLQSAVEREPDEAPNAEACREHAELAGLPVDDVIALNLEIGPDQFK